VGFSKNVRQFGPIWRKSMEKHVYCGKKYSQNYGSLLFPSVQMIENGKNIAMAPFFAIFRTNSKPQPGMSCALLTPKVLLFKPLEPFCHYFGFNFSVFTFEQPALRFSRPVNLPALFARLRMSSFCEDIRRRAKKAGLTTINTCR
jgi:hypothetical protein